MDRTSMAHWAVRYIDRLGLKLAPLHGKAPYRDGWNSDDNLIGSADAALDHWTRNPHDNVGACLAASGLVSLDCDDLAASRTVLAAEGVDLDALIGNTPTIIGRSPRLEFMAPDIELGRKSVVWPRRATAEKPVTVIEFRAGRVQDVLPPSIHPDLNKPYRWVTPPREGFPPLPAKLLELWLAFDSFRHRARNLCPWAPPEPEPVPRSPRPHTGPSVIQAFNDAHDPVALLEANGYERAGRKRWKSPHGKNLAGVVLLPDGKIFCHHTTDPLGDEKPHDAFDLFALFEHGGDMRAATRAAAELLGIRGGAAA